MQRLFLEMREMVFEDVPCSDIHRHAGHRAEVSSQAVSGRIKTLWCPRAAVSPNNTYIRSGDLKICVQQNTAKCHKMGNSVGKCFNSLN